MALTPEDVVKKEFTKPKGFGKNGYDEIQVDDFLDEIVVELRRLNAENDELSSQLADCRRSSGQPAGSVRVGGASAVPGAGGVSAEEQRKLVDLRSQIASAERDLKTLQDRTSSARVADGDARRLADDHSAASANLSSAQQELKATEAKLAQARADLARAQQDTRAEQEKLTGLRAQVAQAEKDVAAAREQASAARSAQPSNPQSPAAAGAAGGAAGVIALAQKLHDEHVREGESTRDKLITSAQAHYDKVVGEASSRHDELLRTGQRKYDDFLSTGKVKHDELVNSGQSKHDELVRTGQSKHDELVRTGQVKHDELVTTGQGTHDNLVRTANEERSSVLTALTTQRDGLNSSIESLRGFEIDYRSRLRGYIESQLDQLKSVGADDLKPPSGD